MLNIAMWSGPRNISTAMMRAWENRSDSMVMDEPFYAAYLSQTKLQHPMHQEIIDSGEADWKQVVEQCTQNDDHNKVCYQKHMTHHMLGNYDLAWLGKLKHAFLLRNPRDVLWSYQQKHQATSLEDIGISQQLQLLKKVVEITGKQPFVIDSQRFLQDPEKHLKAMCNNFGIDFQLAMLQWQPGARDSDGVWASHWYDKVWSSTGFVSNISNHDDTIQTRALNKDLTALLKQAEPLYDELLSYHY